jgi:hypothetical protein
MIEQWLSDAAYHCATVPAATRNPDEGFALVQITVCGEDVKRSQRSQYIRPVT